MKNTLFIIDAYNLIYRMFYAIPEMNTRSGEPVNAIFGVAKFLKGLAEENPDALMVVANDVGKSFRADIFTEYKGTRDRMPDNLRSQIDGVFVLFDAAKIQVLSQDGYEADDIIGSIAHQHTDDECQIVIISSDKDLCQFVRDGHVHIYDAMKRKFMRESDVVEKFGVPAHQVRDYLAIVGDSSDNIPGISGFGPKKATDLLSQYASLEGIYEQIGIKNVQIRDRDDEVGDEVSQKFSLQKQGIIQFFYDSEKYEKSEISEKIKKSLLEQIENAFLSQKLAHIVTDLDIPKIGTAPFSMGVNNDSYREILQKYEFRSLLPSDALAPKKSLEKAHITSIETPSALQDLETLLRKISTVTLSTDAYGKIILGVGDEVFSLEHKKIDLNSIITTLLESEIRIIGYDLKTDIKRLYAIQKPLQKVVEGQGMLF